jgi:starch-binding outer membrane protein, SusD/RagB family
MKKNLIPTLLLLVCTSIVFFSCKKDYGNLNSPTIESFLNNASKNELNNLVSGTESGMRNAIAFYLDNVGSLGREGYRFSGSEPRYVTDLLGANAGTLSNSNFYIANPWAARYRVVKNCNVLIEAAGKSNLITANEKSGYSGFAKTIKAYQLLMNLNLTYTNGIRIDVADPDHLGGFLNYPNSLVAIASLLDSGRTDLATASMSFPLAGFTGFNNAAGLLAFNRALAARVAVYQENWDAALTALNLSFFGLDKPFGLGIYHVFGTGSGDQLNPMFIPQNQSGEIRVAHPSYATDLEPGDDRLNKATLRTTTASLSGLSSNRDVWVYTSSTANVPIIRNEELILIYAEVNIQKNNFPEAIKAINKIRTGHNLPNYSGALTTGALTTELLKQRRYSLFWEGHRWVDMRRYNLLSQLPVDRPADDVWDKFPIPLTEQ